MTWRNPDYKDEAQFNPEPDDGDELPPRELIGLPLAYEGAIVIQRSDGDFECEHGRNITGSPTATARGCLTHCQEGETA